ncbi:helix-turn-helix transcriptional regulator [Amycolatopsis regifaucium]|uniref:LysR family transcriptional regulator n=1 Tax=Amycolatopsis regifaucium TaxID=546365 RepID=A0A154MVR8_9PSEU|nr:LuxR C-terminal-related transcriptional regulator [Amycolatopsis regifaucium]KZB88406.1 LysR family transcriptional regulator [Amycolatopsis regifaucium]OKA04548.1 LysR family transcriptional regulator [Amycolatopsis regifaucium]
MARRRGGPVGRKAELATLVADRRTVGPTVVSGLPGSGKSALLDEVRRTLAESGAPVLSVSLHVERPEWDLFGFRSVLAAIREQYEQFETDSKLPESLERVSGSCTEAAYADPWSRFCLLHAMSTLFTRLETTAPVTVLLDDADRLPDPVLAVAPMHRAGHTVIASCRTPLPGRPDPFRGTQGRTIELGPLPPEEATALLRRAVGARITPAVEQAVRRALGPLWGHPAALLSTVTELRRGERLQVVDGLAHLRDAQAPIAVPDGHPFSEVLEGLGVIGERLVLLAAGSPGLALEEIPYLEDGDGTGKTAGRAADALIEAGLLDRDPDGRIRCRVPGIGAAMVHSGLHVRRLHRAVAEGMLGSGRVTGPHREPLARHIAAAGSAMPPRTDHVGLLRAAECALAADSPERTAHLHAIWRHTGRTADRAGRQTELFRHLVRTADYPALETFVQEALTEAPGADERAELAVAAVLSAVHLGRPVPENVRDRLVGDEATLEFADRWFAGRRIVPEDVELSLLPIWRQVSFAAPAPGRRRKLPDDELAEACAIRDLVPVFRTVLGRDYRTPSSGPVAAHHRMRTAHAEGRWEEALEAVNELEAHDSVDELVREHTRLLAAEVCGRINGARRAAGWLAKVPLNGSLPLLRAWVEMGAHQETEDDREAFESGWRALWTHFDSADEVGAARLFLRLARSARRDGDAVRHDEVVEAAEKWFARKGTSHSSELPALVRALVNGDETGASPTERVLVGLGRFPADVRTENGGGEAAGRRGGREPLSETEIGILDLVRDGRTNRQIARAVRISEKTVEKHLTRLFAKAGCRTRYGLATSSLGRRSDVIGA